MLATLTVALTVLSSLTLDVPYLPQTDALCGGAAVAMVYRYWGDAHADVDQFRTLVDRRAGGIADDVLATAVRQRGWTASRTTGAVDELRARLHDRQPVIVLIADRRDTYHYAVVIGATATHIVVHDPSWGPSRKIEEAEFVRLWKPTRFWGLVVVPGPSATPGPTRETPVASGFSETSVVSGFSRTFEDQRCAALLDTAITDLQQRDLAAADSLVNDVRRRCPAFAGPLRELAAVRFVQRRWSEAADLARQAIALDDRDEYTWDLLGSSLFIRDDGVGALRAWNRIGKPRVNLVKIDGIRRVRYQVIADTLGIRPNALLTAEAFERARRRLDELPDRATARLAFKPEADGFATVDVVISERSTRPRGTTAWAAAAVRSGIDRELDLSAPGLTGQGELWTASWRWWANRPRVAIGFATPRVGRLPGVWRVDASWETQTYALDAAGRAALTRESRTHGGLTISDWITGTLRYSLGAGADSWNGEQRTMFAAASLERRLLNDRVSLSANGSTWSSLTRGRGFNRLAAGTVFHSSTELDGWIYRAAAGIERVSSAAPLALWPGAGDGHARTPLLRAHPLLRDGIVDASRPSAFGRTLLYTSAEAQRWLDRPLLPRVGIAGFVDVAHANRSFVDVGTGLRIKIPGTEGVLRVDVAHAVGDRARALTVGWQVW